MKEMLDKAELIVSRSSLTVASSTSIITMGYKLLSKVEELRKSRDNWRNKYKNSEK